MEKLNNIVYVLVTVVVTIIIIATIAIPVVSDSQSSLATYENNTVAPKYTLLETVNENLEISFNHTSGVLSINDEEYTNVSSDGAGIVAFSDDFLIIGGANGFSLWATTHYYQNTVDWSLDITGTSWSASAPAYPDFYNSGTLDYLLVADENGTYGVYSPTDWSDVKISNDSNIAVMQCRQHFGHTIVSSFDTIENLTFLDYAQPSAGYISEPSEPQVSELVYENVGREIYSISTWHITTSDGSVIANLNHTFLIAPIQYNVWEDNNGIYYTLLSILPIILLMIPVFFVARILSNGRD